MPGEKIGEAYVELKAKMSKFEAELKSAQMMTDKSVDKMQARFNALGKTFSKVGKGMAIGGGAITAALGATIYASANLEKQLANVSTMLDSEAMPIMGRYKDTIKAMATEFGESTETLSKGLYDILSASIKPTKALDVLDVAARAAAAGITDTGVAADAITTIINSYGLAAEDASSVSDRLFGIVKRGKTTFGELAPNIGKVAATAAQAGLGFNELGATIATLTRSGIKTEETMTAINGILRAFLKSQDDAKEVAKEFGFELNTNTLRAEGLVGIIKKLNGATAEQLAQIFPNIRGLKGIAAALGSAEGYMKDYKLMTESTGLTQEAFAKQTGTLSFKFNQMKESVIMVATEIGDILLPAVKNLVDKILPVIENLKKWAKEHKGLVDTIVKFAAVLGPVLLSLGGLFMILGQILPVLPALGTAFSAMLGPIGLVVSAVAAIAAGLIYFYKTSEKFRGVVNRIGGFFKNKILWIVKNWKLLGSSILEIMKISLGYLWKLVKGFFTDWSQFKAWLVFWGKLGESVLKIMGHTFLMIGKVVARASSIIWAPLIKSLQWVGENIWYYFNLGIEKARNGIYKGVEWIVNKIFIPMANKFIWLSNMMIGGAEAFINFFISGLNGLWGVIKKVLSPVAWFIDKIFKTDFQKSLEDMGEIAKVEFGRIKEIAEDALTIKIPESTLKAPEGFTARMSEAWEIIKSQYSEIPADLKKYVADLAAEWENVKSAAGELGVAINYEDYRKKLDAVIEKLKAAGIETKELEEIEKGLNETTEELGKTFEGTLTKYWKWVKGFKYGIGTLTTSVGPAFLKLTEAERKWYKESTGYVGNFALFTSEQVEKLKEDYAEYQKNKAEKAREAREKIEAEYYKLTHTEKQLLDKQWKLEEKRLKDLGLTDKEILKARYVFYYEYHQKVKKLLDKLTDEQKAYYEEITGKTVDWSNLTVEEIEKIIKELKELEKAGITARSNWQKAWEGFTTELWVKFKTIGLEKLGELGTAIEGLANIIKGEVSEGAKLLADSFIGLLTRSEAFKQLVEMINPIIDTAANAFGALLKPLLPIVETLANSLKPVLRTLAPLFEVIGQILAYTLKPALEILEPVLKIIADVFYSAASIVAGIWNALADAVNFLLGWLGVKIEKIELPEKPKWPEAQMGMPYVPQEMPVIAHPGEAILTASQAKRWREGIGETGGVYLARGAVQLRITNLNTKADEEQLVGLVEDTITRTMENRMRRI